MPPEAATPEDWLGLARRSLDRLLALLPQDLEVPDAVARSVWLSESYLVTRYFADEPLPSTAQVIEARAAADVVVAWAATIVDSPPA